ncbi:MAG: hypothetical protein D6723_20030 [Acidobacteria bacterium]|nr:MAG: hypothetical protein D6723_20030 [Acidobacteriota bacterium]
MIRPKIIMSQRLATSFESRRFAVKSTLDRWAEDSLAGEESKAVLRAGDSGLAIRQHKKKRAAGSVAALVAKEVGYGSRG